ncbi:MAG: DUF302 domain-containing protein [bacterium]|nr:DUF302 domain-containing protein [bacterium]
MYGFSTQLTGTIDEVKARVREALAGEGFGVLTEIDVQAVMKAKLDLDRRPYLILGACNPNFAHQALDADPDIGLLLPCNVVIRTEEDGLQTVAFMDPLAVLGLVDRLEVNDLGKEVRGRLMHIRDQLASQ